MLIWTLWSWERCKKNTFLETKSECKNQIKLSRPFYRGSRAFGCNQNVHAALVTRGARRSKRNLPYVTITHSYVLAFSPLGFFYFFRGLFLQKLFVHPPILTWSGFRAFSHLGRRTADTFFSRSCHGLIVSAKQQLFSMIWFWILHNSDIDSLHNLISFIFWKVTPDKSCFSDGSCWEIIIIKKIHTHTSNILFEQPLLKQYVAGTGESVDLLDDYPDTLFISREGGHRL